MKKKSNQKMNSKAGPDVSNDAQMKIKGVGAPVLSPIKKKKLTVLANKKQKLVQETQKNSPVANVMDDSNKPSKSQTRRSRKRLSNSTAEITDNKKPVTNKQKNTSGLDDSTNNTEETALEKSVIFKAFVSGFTNQTSNSDLRVALTSGGAQNVEFVKVIKGRKGAHGIVGFADEDSLNEAVKLSNKVKVMNKPLKIDVMKKKGNQPKAKNKKGNKDDADEEEESEEEEVDDNDEEDEDEENEDEEKEDTEIVNKPKAKPRGANKSNANGLKKEEKKFQAVVKNLSKSCKVKQVQDSLSKSDLVVSSAIEVRKGQDVHVLVTFPDEDNRKKALELKQISVNNENFDIAPSLGKGRKNRKRGGRRRNKKSKSPGNSPVATPPAKNANKAGKVSQDNSQQNNKKPAAKPNRNNTKQPNKLTPQQAKKSTPKKPARKSNIA